MASTKYKNKSQSRQWLITFLCLVIFIFGVLYFYKWQQVKNEEKYVTSYLMSSNTINYEMNEIEEISSVLSETANYYFVYISYTNDADVYNLEKSLKPIIDKYDLNNNFYYINVTNIKENNANYKKEIADRLNIDEKEMNNIPIIMYFKDGVLTQSAKTAKDLENLVKNQGINSL